MQGGLTGRALGVAVKIHEHLAQGYYDETLTYQTSSPLEAITREEAFKSSSDVFSDSEVAYNDGIREGIEGALKFSSKTFTSISENDTPIPIPDDVQIALDKLLPPDQKENYTKAQLSSALDYVSDVMTMPPILSEYQSWEVNQNNPSVFMALQDNGYDFTQEKAHAVLAATVASTGYQVNIEQYAKADDVSARVEFTRDPVFIAPDGVVYVPTQVRDDILKEQPALISSLQSQGYTNFVEIDADFEGGSVTYDSKRETVYMSNMDDKELTYEQDIARVSHAAEQLEKTSGLDTTVLVVKEEETAKFFHLDTFMKPLPNGEILLFPDALTDESLKLLEQQVGNENIIPMTREDAERFSSNAVVGRDNNTLIMAHASPELEATLNSKGYEVITPQDQGVHEGLWKMHQGGPHCMTQYPDFLFEDVELQPETPQATPALEKETTPQINR